MLTRENTEHLLATYRLQIMGRGGRWYDVRRNGATQRWKRQPLRASIPCKVGFYECFRIEFNERGETYETLRARPVDFNTRTRS